MLSIVIASACVLLMNTFAFAASGTPKLLPAGYLSARGNQIVDGHGKPVRIASVGGLGTVIDTPHLSYNVGPYKGIDENIAAMRKLGFNCIRADFNNKCLDNGPLMADFDKLVATCKKYGIKVILCHHNDEATAKDWGNAAQQTNGLWFDTGRGTDGSDDSTGRPRGTISDEKFLQDWVTVAKRYAGNDTVIGFDLDNEPCGHYKKFPPVWGEGGPDDMHAMYQRVGDAILKVNPGALIICEAIINWPKGEFEGDLSIAQKLPVRLTNPHKVVYSLHCYPFSKVPNTDGAYIARMNKLWGCLIKKNIAPVWIGEMGDSMDVDNQGVSKAEQNEWGRTLLGYMNGRAPGGIRFSAAQQPISGDWWWWNYAPGESPDGCLTKDGTLKPAQKVFIEQMLFWPAGHNYAKE
jgi:aryl-phospho-beta-D-glucosidase BglC (GH1 family)